MKKIDRTVLAMAGALAMAPVAAAQERAYSPEELREMTAQASEAGARFEAPAGFAGTTPEEIEALRQRLGFGLRGERRNTIVVTGYWPPTNEMLRQFSPSPVQNPGAWVGENWEGRGYDIIAFFPEFPDGLGRGVGDFEVDYQDTVADWQTLLQPLDPIAIITFSRGFNDSSWEIEARARNFSWWIDDYLPPFQPTPVPPDATVAWDFVRFSSLPMDDIVSEVGSALPGVNVYIDDFDDFGGNFLSGFINYFGVWERDERAEPSDPEYIVGAGHIHVGGFTPIAEAVEATEITLRELIRTINRDVCTGDLDGDGLTGSADLGLLLGAWGSTGGAGADLDGDGAVGSGDLAILLGAWGPCF